MLAAKKLYPEAALVFPGSQEKNLRNFFLSTTSYIFNFIKIKQINFDHVKKLILVDTRQRNRIGKFAKLLDKKDIEVHIYDHHPDSKDDIHGTLEIIKETGSNTTILTEIIKEKGIQVSSDEATIMCLGIHEDTGSFTFNSTTEKDHMAAAWLIRQGANLNIISDMLTRELSAEQIWLLNDLTRSATTQRINGIEIVISKIIREEYIGDLAVLVHKFMDMENLNVLFALAQMEDRIYLVARSRKEDVNVAEIALAFGGGGHPMAASATIKNKTLIQVEKTLHSLLISRINPRKTARDMMSSPAIHIPPDRPLKEAATQMTKYSINVLLVIDTNGKLMGYITRQITEKAVFFGLGHIPVKDYINIDFSVVSPEMTLDKVQDLIIKKKLRFLPVIENKKVIGVITRRDLMNILVGGPVIPNFLYDSDHVSQFTRKKNITSMLKERLPDRLLDLCNEFGRIADTLGYDVYLIGGLVRDIFLKRENLDVDIVIEGDGIKFAHTFAELHEVRIRSHKKFGTAILIFPDGFKVDVATTRMEYYETPAAPPTVETSSLKMDLFRRDFTINTLAIQLNKVNYGTLVDYFGGQKDLKEKVIRVLHNLSFVEDPTRVLRAIRFEQRFGFKIGKLTLTLMKNAVDINSFKDLSGRRLFSELKLLFMDQHPIQSIERMDELDLLGVISPEIKLTQTIKKLLIDIRNVISWFSLLYLEEIKDVWKIYWYGLISSLDSDSLNDLIKRMQLEDPENYKMITRISETQSVLDRLYKLEEDSNFIIYTLLSQYDTEILLYMMAKANNEKIKKIISHYFTKLKETKVLLRGKDLKKMGIKPGPIYKEIFDTLLEAKLNRTIETKRDEMALVSEKFTQA